jgi:hypothetical protein
MTRDDRIAELAEKLKARGLHGLANDAAVAGRRPLTLDELVAELRGPASLPPLERRMGGDRRGGGTPRPVRPPASRRTGYMLRA